MDIGTNYVNHGGVFHATGDLMAAKERYNSELKYLKKGLNQSMFLFVATYNHLGATLYGLGDLQAAKES